MAAAEPCTHVQHSLRQSTAAEDGAGTGASAFIEYSGAKPPKSKHRVTFRGAPFMAVAATWNPAKGNEPASFAMVTVDPGPDILPYHPRQMAVLPPSDWKR
jgi:putative SOS response-associated peptidase YedK